jgi:hypothetical protein
MSEKHPRDMGGGAALKNPDDGTPIRESLVVGDALLFFTDKCTYRIQMADQIDPGRTNPDLAQVAQQKIFDHGAKSDLMRGTLLHARVMFKEGFQEIDIPRALSHSFDALSNLIAMRDLELSFAAKVDAAMAKAGAGEREDAKSFIQRADHFSHDLLEIVRLFFPEMKAKSWSEFQELAGKQYGDDDQMTKFLAEAVSVFQILRDARNCLDHHLNGVVLSDFALEKDGSIMVPTIEINHKSSKQPRQSLVQFMHEVTEWMLLLFEQVTVHMCDKKLKSFSGMPFVIGEVEPPMSENWPCRYAYGLFYEGQGFVPCG